MIELPVPFVQRIKKQFPQHTGIIESLTGSAISPTIRLNTARNYNHLGEVIPWCKRGRILSSRPVFTLDPYFHAGYYYVQESSSMFLEEVFNQLSLVGKDLIVLDACASPGGKTTHLLNLTGPGSLIVANETIRNRIPALKENLAKWGYENCVITNNELSSFENLDLFDLVIADLPCSGEGLFRKDKKAISEWSEQQAKFCAMRQQSLLPGLVSSLKPGGYLLYSTCTFNPEENEENIVWLTENFSLESVSIPVVSEWQIETIRYKNTVGYYFLPGSTPGEGFFISILRKCITENQPLHKIKHRNTFESINKFPDWLFDALRPSEKNNFTKTGNLIHYFQNKRYPVLSALDKQLNIISYGTTVAEQKGNEWQPVQELCLHKDFSTSSFNSMDVTYEEALNYLRRQSLNTSNRKNEGLVVVSFQDIPLGFGRIVNGRLNNYYPKHWRIKNL